MKNLYLIVGESGSGKSIIVDTLVKRYALTSIESYTTRPPRFKNESGHKFVSALDMPNKSEMVGYTFFNGNHYWATHTQANESDLYVIDVNGINFLKSVYRGYKKIKVIYISVDYEIRKNRMIARGDDIDKVCERLNHDVSAFQNLEYDKQFVNINIETTVAEVYNYILECENR